MYLSAYILFYHPSERPPTHRGTWCVWNDISPHPVRNRMMILTWLLHASNTLPSLSLSLTLMRSRCGFHLHTDVSHKIGWLGDEQLRAEERCERKWMTVFSPCRPVAIVLENMSRGGSDNVTQRGWDEVVCFASTYLWLCHLPTGLPFDWMFILALWKGHRYKAWRAAGSTPEAHKRCSKNASAQFFQRLLHEI